MKRPSLVRTFPLAALSALAVIAVTSITAGAQATDPYKTGDSGYDVSYPNPCNASAPGTFGIVGVNGGRPFTYNSNFAPTSTCSGQYATAVIIGSASVYINTAYSLAYKRNIDATHCTPAPTDLTGSYAQAWEIGCSEATTSFYHFTMSPAPAMWWLDVETANSWSSSNVQLNVDAIRGAADELHALAGTAVGIYSRASYWNTITHDANVYPIVDAEWDTAVSMCPTPPAGAIWATGFTGAPIWLAQTGTWANGLDLDSAC